MLSDGFSLYGLTAENDDDFVEFRLFILLMVIIIVVIQKFISTADPWAIENICSATCISDANYYYKISVGFSVLTVVSSWKVLILY